MKKFKKFEKQVESIFPETELNDLFSKRSGVPAFVNQQDVKPKPRWVNIFILCIVVLVTGWMYNEFGSTSGNTEIVEIQEQAITQASIDLAIDSFANFTSATIDYTINIVESQGYYETREALVLLQACDSGNERACEVLLGFHPSARNAFQVKLSKVWKKLGSRGKKILLSLAKEVRDSPNPNSLGIDHDVINQTHGLYPGFKEGHEFFEKSMERFFSREPQVLLYEEYYWWRYLKPPGLSLETNKNIVELNKIYQSLNKKLSAQNMGYVEDLKRVESLVKPNK